MSAQIHRWPDYEHLCDLADVKGLRVHLAADDAVSLFGRHIQDPAITRIELREPGGAMRPMIADIYDDDLDAAARQLLARL